MFAKLVYSILFIPVANIYVLELGLILHKLEIFFPIQIISFPVHMVSLFPVLFYVLWSRNVTKISKFYAWLLGTAIVSVIMNIGTAIVENTFREDIQNHMMDTFGKVGKAPTFIEKSGAFTLPGISTFAVGLVAVLVSIFLAKRLLKKEDNPTIKSSAIEANT